MTKPVNPNIPTETQHGDTPPTRSQLVRLQEFFRKCGIPIERITKIVLKRSCVEATLIGGARRVFVPAWYG